MDNIDRVILWLDSFEFATYIKKDKIFSIIKDYNIFLDKEKFLKHKDVFLKIFKENEFNDLLRNFGEKYIDKLISDLEKLNIKFITRNSKYYPETLENIDSPPFIIYYKGNIELLKTNCFAVVGSRTITNYGKMTTEKFVKGLCEVNFTIVSGLAVGVDTVAHKTALQFNGKTIGVLAGGLDEIYPTTNSLLAQEIVRNGGLIISENRPYKRAEAFMFPIRNRIIAGLSRAVLITEAGENSGSNHTKNYAIDYGRDVFAIPGSIFSALSLGTNRMIVNGQAKAVIDINDILDEYSISRYASTKPLSSNFTYEENIIIDLLRERERTFQELVETSGLDVKKLNTLLTLLSIRGIIKKLAGNVYFLN